MNYGGMIDLLETHIYNMFTIFEWLVAYIYNMFIPFVVVHIVLYITTRHHKIFYWSFPIMECKSLLANKDVSLYLS